MDATPLIGPEGRGSATLLARLLAIADDAVLVVDASLRIVLFNQGAERMFGYRADEVLGEPLDLLLPESARAAHEHHMRAFAAAPVPARRMGDRREVQGRRADGSCFDADASIAHLVLDGRPVYTAIVRDVSEARRAQRALAGSEARFRGLAAAAPVGIFQTDAAGACLYANERWCEIMGLGAERALGSTWLGLVHPADREAVHAAWRLSAADPADKQAARPIALRFRLLRPDGGETWVQGHAVPSFAEGGQGLGRIGTLADVTEARAQSVALERAKSEAEAAARAKSLFLANMSHEIRTPLNAVIGMTTLLLDTPMSEDQREFARTIRAGGEQLLDVINDILDFSKADVGKLELEQRAFDLRRCVEESLDLLSPRALEKGLNIAYLIEDGTPESLVGDAVRLRQILVNLLSNAVKFTHQGEVLLLVEGTSLDAERCRLRITVRDTGIGIAEQHLPLLFQSFSQVDPSTTRQYGGTGLGLAITQRLAQLMGGQVSVKSVLGQGSSFEVLLELGLAPPAPAAEYLRRDAPALRGRRLLIVDDNLTNRRILTKFGLLWGMVPSTVASPLEALDRVRHGERFDVAVLDMSMPGLDGIGLAAEIRRRRPAEELPIVLLTSLGQRQATAAAREVPLQACLTKPIKAGALYDTLVTVLSGAGRVSAAPAPEAPAPRPSSPGLRLLVAEDHPVNQRVIMRLVQHLGHRVDLVTSGMEAVQAVAEREYDVVLMDIQMPGLDGVEAARRIVAARGTSALPRIIAMTANAMPGDRERYVAAGMDGYLAKPVELDALASTLTQVHRLVSDTDAALRADSVLDLARLEHLRALQDDAQPTLVRELIDQFIAEASMQVQRIADAAQLGDAALLRGIAHRFLSATQNIGAHRLSRLCEELERLARAEHLAPAAELVQALPGESERAVRALALVRMRY
jgi:PAS domain S-box-containing protein